MVKYIPKQGDIVYFKKNNPAIVISNNVFNINTKMIILCPIISNEDDYPTHYKLEDSKKIKGLVLCEHIKSINYETNKINFIERASNNDLLSVIMLNNACIEE